MAAVDERDIDRGEVGLPVQRVGEYLDDIRKPLLPIIRPDLVLRRRIADDLSAFRDILGKYVDRVNGSVRRVLRHDRRAFSTGGSDLQQYLRVSVGACAAEDLGVANSPVIEVRKIF